MLLYAFTDHLYLQVKQLLPPRIFIILGENDTPSITAWSETFGKALREKGVKFQEHIMKGHNHISSNLALNSGEGEEWGEEIAKWIKA